AVARPVGPAEPLDDGAGSGIALGFRNRGRQLRERGAEGVVERGPGVVDHGEYAAHLLHAQTDRLGEGTDDADASHMARVVVRAGPREGDAPTQEALPQLERDPRHRGTRGPRPR